MISANLFIAIAPTASWAFARPPGFGGGNNGGGNTGANGSPLPLLGGTLLGHGTVLGGAYIVWRRFRRKKKAAKS